MIQPRLFIGHDPKFSSESRILAARELVKKGLIPEDAIMVWPQGFSKRNPKVPGLHIQSLGANMDEYSRGFEEFQKMKSLIKSLSWKTVYDMLASYEMVKENGYKQAHFYFVTDPLHLVRVRMIWCMTHPDGWEASFFPAHNDKRGWFGYIYEATALCKAYIFLRLRGYSLKRS